jgi:hypothetical protein
MAQIQISPVRIRETGREKNGEKRNKGGSKRKINKREKENIRIKSQIHGRWLFCFLSYHTSLEYLVQISICLEM